MPVARRVLGEDHELTLRLRTDYATLYGDLDDLHEAVRTLADIERTARRVLGGAHPLTGHCGRRLLDARAALRARETSPGTG